MRWTFLWSGAEFHTMEWDEGATLDNKLWQAPDYCFNQPSPDDPPAGSKGTDSRVCVKGERGGRRLCVCTHGSICHSRVTCLARQPGDTNGCHAW